MPTLRSKSFEGGQGAIEKHPPSPNGIAARGTPTQERVPRVSRARGRQVALHILKPRRVLPERSPAKAQCQSNFEKSLWMDV